MITATRKIHFCAGHRVFQHGSKCRNLHGHNYVAWITAEVDELNPLGMVVDFSVLKDKVGGWVDQYWDHGFIYYAEDFAAERALVLFEETEGPDFAQKRFALPVNPTAENMAKHLLKVGNYLLKDDGVRVTEVTLFETENCYATVTV